MWLDLLLFSITVMALGWAFDQRNARIRMGYALESERSLSETLGRALAQARTRQELAERELAALGHGPAPRSERRARREA